VIKLSSLTPDEKRQRAKNKIQLMRRKVKQHNKARMLALVREYVSQNPDLAMQIVKKWIG
jgi:flagellar biosynthesis/type III secretory pathway M-ring protein FliF/YscJ